MIRIPTTMVLILIVITLTNANTLNAQRKPLGKIKIFDEIIYIDGKLDHTVPKHFVGSTIFITISNSFISVIVDDNDNKRLVSYIPLAVSITYSLSRELAQGSGWQNPKPESRDSFDIFDFSASVMGSIIPHLIFNNLVFNNNKKSNENNRNKYLRIEYEDIRNDRN